MYEAQNFDRLLGTQGFSDTLLKNHFTLYQGYVKNTNTLVDKLTKLSEAGTFGEAEFMEMKRRFGWEWNGMRLHELYFGNMAKGGVGFDASGSVADKIKKTFGSVDVWQKHFKGVGAMRGIGWAVMTYDKQADTIFNIWVNEHDVGHLAGTTPLLIMDVFEHAFMIDYGLKRADYIEAFMASVDWETVEKRVTA